MALPSSQLIMIVSIVNQKGGTGKTTTTVNLGKALALKGFQVLLVDLDPQANLSYSLAVENIGTDITDVIHGVSTIVEAIVSREQMDVIPGNIQLSRVELSANRNNEFILKLALEDAQSYDYVLIDCPPSLSWLTMNALVASDCVLIPMQLDVFSIQGLRQIMNTVTEVAERHNPNLQILGVLPVMVDWRKKLTHEVLEHVREEFNVMVFDSFIRTNVKAAEAPSFGKSVISYAVNSNSAKDYLQFSEELSSIINQIKNLEISN